MNAAFEQRLAVADQVMGGGGEVIVDIAAEEERLLGKAFFGNEGEMVEHDPAFIGPLSSRRSTPTSTGRAGIAGWVSPNTPVGSPVSGWGEVTGYFALGFSMTWDGPPPTRPPAPAR